MLYLLFLGCHENVSSLWNWKRWTQEDENG
jgi:hypothetical protein